MNQIDTPSKTESLAEAQTVQLDDWEEQLSPIKPLRSAPFSRNNSHARIPSTASDKIARSGHARIPSTASSIGTSRGLRRKGSAMFSSGNISDSQSEKGSPATPTRNLPFATGEFPKAWLKLTLSPIQVWRVDSVSDNGNRKLPV